MENEVSEKEVVTSEAAHYTLLPGENVLLELKVKSFGDDSVDINVVETASKNPFAFIGKILAKIKKLVSCSCFKDQDIPGVAEGGLFVVTSHRCFVTKDYIEHIANENKSKFIRLLVSGCIVILLGFFFEPLRNQYSYFLVNLDLLRARPPHPFLVIAGGALIVFAIIMRKKKAQFLKEDHEFISFPRSVLTEYNSFTCNKEFLTGVKTGCCGSNVGVSLYKTVLTVGLNTKGEHSAIEPEKTIEMVLDPEQVSNHQQALAVISKLAELAQKAN